MVKKLFIILFPLLPLFVFSQTYVIRTIAVSSTSDTLYLKINASGSSTDSLYRLINGSYVFANTPSVKTFFPYQQLTNKPTTLSGFGITNGVVNTTTVNGQSLSSNVTVSTVTGNAGTATALATPRSINGINFDGTAAITITAAAGTLTGATLNSTVTGSSLTSFGASIALGTPASGTLTNCTFPTLNQATTNSAGSLKSVATTGLMTVTGMGAATTRAKTVRDADDTFLELGGSYTPTGTWTSLTMVTPVLGTPTSGNLANCTFPTLNQNTSGTALNITASSNTSLTSLSNLATIGTITSGGLGTGAVIGGVTMTLGSDAANDVYYRNSSGVLTRLANGTTGQLLTATTNGAPSWTTAAGSGTVTAIGVTTANGVSGSSSGGATPNLTITLGAITPTTVAPTGTITTAAGTTSLTPLNLNSSSVLRTTPSVGDVEYDGKNLYFTPESTMGHGFVPDIQRFRLTADGSTISTISNFFGATSNPTLVSGAEYLIEIDCYYTNTTSGTVTWTFTNSAAPTSQNIWFHASAAAGIVAPAGSAAATYLDGNIQADATAAKALTTSATLTTATTQWAHFSIHLFNGTGTSLKIQATKLVGGTITPLKGSYWTCTRIPSGNTGTFAN